MYLKSEDAGLLAKLAVGDTVLIATRRTTGFSSGIYLYTEAKVSRVTKTQFTAATIRFMKSDGKEVGKGRYSTFCHWAVPDTEKWREAAAKNEDQYKEHEVREGLMAAVRGIRWSAIPNDKIAAALKVLGIQHEE
jgi:hypothetical protein